MFHTEERVDPSSSSDSAARDFANVMNNPEDQTSMIIMNNYFGIGIDADICLMFHTEREENPDKFNSRYTKFIFFIMNAFSNNKQTTACISAL